MKLFEITDVAMPESENGKQQITPMQIPAFPEFPKQVGDLGNGASASQTKNGGTKLSSGQGTFVWDKAGQPSKWQAPTFGGMSQLYDIRTGDITARYKSGGLDVTMVYDKTGKAKQDSGSASYNMGIAKASTGPQGNSITVQGGSPEQDQTVKTKETATVANPNLEKAIATAMTAYGIEKDGSISGNYGVGATLQKSDTVNQKAAQLKAQAEKLGGVPYKELVAMGKQRLAKDTADLTNSFNEAGEMSAIDAYKQSFGKKKPPEKSAEEMQAETYREQLIQAIKKYGNNAIELEKYIRSDSDFMLWFAKLPERDYLKKDAMDIMRSKVSETATAGSTSSGSMATVANPASANAKIKRDKNGVPMAPQKKNADGTAKNALELGNNLMGGATVKR